ISMPAARLERREKSTGVHSGGNHKNPRIAGSSREKDGNNASSVVSSLWARASRRQLIMEFVSIPDALDEIRRGRMVIVVDDDDRENEGDLTLAAEHVTPEIINFMAVHGRGLVCLAPTGERCDELNLPMMSRRN